MANMLFPFAQILSNLCHPVIAKHQTTILGRAKDAGSALVWVGFEELAVHDCLDSSSKAFMKSSRLYLFCCQTKKIFLIMIRFSIEIEVSLHVVEAETHYPSPS